MTFFNGFLRFFLFSPKTHNCGGAKNKIVLVIPEDEGLKEKIEKVIADADTRGVTIEVVPSYGKGASKTEEKDN